MSLYTLTYKSEFAINFLMLINRMVIQGDHDTVSQLGARKDQIDVLQTLNTQELQQLALIAKTNFFTVSINPDLLDKAITLNQKRVNERKLMLRLLQAGASRSIMNQLFGLSPKDIGSLKLYVGQVPNVQGRTPAPSEHEETIVWHAWQDMRDKDYDLSNSSKVL